MSGGVGVDSNDTVLLLGDGPHGGSPLGQRDGEMSAREVRRQTCNESRPWSDRLLIKPSERAEPASPPAIDGHINCKASADPHTMACGAESLRSHDHNRGDTNSASQPQASQHEPYRLLSLNSLPSYSPLPPTALSITCQTSLSSWFPSRCRTRSPAAPAGPPPARSPRSPPHRPTRGLPARCSTSPLRGEATVSA